MYYRTQLVFLRHVQLVFSSFRSQSVLQNLTITVGQTLFKSLPLILVFLVTVVTYAFLGNIFFSHVRTGEAINYRYIYMNVCQYVYYCLTHACAQRV